MTKNVIITTPVFRYIEQALHFSFLMEILPVERKSSMHKIVELMREGSFAGNRDDSSGINFDGLDPMEVRAQCAMVRGAVSHHLPGPEADVVHARYGQFACKKNGIVGVRDYCLPSLSEPTRNNVDAASMMTISVFGVRKDRECLSARKIAAYCGLSSASVGRDIQKIHELGLTLFKRGVGRIEPMFKNQGLVGEGLMR
ncbi:MAG: hypothetical protein LBI35_05180 [Burkholderiales bacterium]|jgi:hypothetical protein|nr:hypothetical protein [Burkholderiales bacterium]